MRALVAGGLALVLFAASSSAHAESHRRDELIVAGAITTFAGGAALGFGLWQYDREQSQRQVTMDAGSQPRADHLKSTFAFVAGSLAVGVGIPLVIYGVSSRPKEPVVAVVPAAAPTFGGVSLAATF